MCIWGLSYTFLQCEKHSIRFVLSCSRTKIVVYHLKFCCCPVLCTHVMRNRENHYILKFLHNDTTFLPNDISNEDGIFAHVMEKTKLAFGARMPSSWFRIYASRGEQSSYKNSREKPPKIIEVYGVQIKGKQVAFFCLLDSPSHSSYILFRPSNFITQR